MTHATPPNAHETVSIKLKAPASLKTALQQMAQSRNISLSALLRMILTEYLRQKT